MARVLFTPRNINSAVFPRHAMYFASALNTRPAPRCPFSSPSRRSMGVNQTLPGKWLVSDLLVDRAAADYDKMLSMSASEIEEVKNKVRTAAAAAAGAAPSC